MPLASYTSPFKPGSAFYSGKGISPLVPGLFPVALNARPYMLDRASNQYSRRFDARVRDTVDQSTEPGEAAINPQGLWRRSQSSWHYGAGQKYSDTVDAEAYRFYESKGVDVWDRAKLTLLKDTTQVLVDTETTLQALTVGTRLYVGTGEDVKYTTDLSTFTDCTSEPGGNVGGMATDGFNVFVAFAANGIHKVTTSSDAFGSHITGTDTFVNLRYVKGRLMASQDNDVYNFTAAGIPGSPLFTHSNTGFRWVGFAGGQNHIYMGGFAGNQSLVYRTTIKDDASSLDTPIVALELPAGEIITGLDSYLDFVLIGTTKGIRVATSDANGNLVSGPLTQTGSSVTSFSGEGRFVWFNWTNFDGASTGLGRLDLGVFVSANQPAYASDLMVTAQGVVGSVNTINSRPVFVVVGSGVYVEHATDLVASGYLDTGIYRWGISDAKFVQRYDIRTLPLAGSIQMSVKSDGGSYQAYVALTEFLETEHILPGLEDKVFEHEARITLNRSSTVNSTGPTVTRWMVRAYAAPDRSEIFIVPLLIHDFIDLDGRTFSFDVNKELNAIRDLVSNPRVVVFQEENAIHSVIVEDVVWQPSVLVSRSSGAKLHGTAIVMMRTVR